MARRNIKLNNKIYPDIKYNSILISKFINILMKNGKKLISKFIVYKSLELISKNYKKDVILIFNEILNNVKPIVEIKSKKIGGSIYNIPTEIKENRRNTLAMRWIVIYARKRSEKSMELKLFNEFNDILQNKGLSIKKRDEVHKTAEANKAFSHYKW